MKKIALTSLLAVFAVSGAHAANVIDGNPLYLPGAGHFYSVSELGSHSDSFETWGFNEEFGYGISDKWAVAISSTIMDEQSFDQWSFGDLSLSTAYRALDMGAWKLDLLGAYSVDPVWGNHESFLDKDATEYIWSAGVRGGYVTSNWTVAAHALFNYWNTESFNWNEDAGERGMHFVTLGLDGQYVLDSHWSVLAGVEYMGVLDKEYRGIDGAKIKNAGSWSAELGVNYNIDSTKFVGAYVSSGLEHKNGESSWEVEDGFGFGAKFGIDF